MKNIHTILALLLAASAIQPLIAQNRYFVNHAATGANTGISWTDAFTDLQAALALAQSGDEVWVAEGAYRPTAGTDRTVSFAPKSGVRLIGGFVGTETELTQRDWLAHPAVLSGDIGAPGDSTDNSYNVVYLHQPDSSTLLDGFFVRHGNADAASGSTYARSRCGGGLYVMGQDWEAYAEIRNCAFEYNTARNYGGGAVVNGSGAGSVAPKFFNCRFEQNRAVVSGGGLAYIGASWVERPKDIDSCLFMDNRAGFSGGGLYWLDFERTDQLDMTNLQFIGNLASNLGGGVHMTVGRQGKSNISANQMFFEENSASDGAALYMLSNSVLSIDSMFFFNFVLSKNKISGFGNTEAIFTIVPFYKNLSFFKIENFIVSNNTSRTGVYLEGNSIDNGSSKTVILMSNILFENNESAILFFLTSFHYAYWTNSITAKNIISSILYSFTRIKTYSMYH